jgi:hypothetical protein
VIGYIIASVLIIGGLVLAAVSVFMIIRSGYDR